MKRKEETVVEEVLEEEVTPTTENEQKSEKEEIENTEFKVVNNTVVDAEGFAVSDSKITDESEKSELFVDIDGMRQEYNKSAKLIKYLSFGIMIPILVGAVCAVFFLSGEGVEDWIKYTVIGVIAALFVGMIVFKFLTKRYLNKKATAYVENYYKKVSTYLFDDAYITDLVVNPKGKVEKEFFLKANIYDELKSVGSRNLVTFKRNDREYSFVDLAASVQGVKRLEPIFVGKVVKAKLNRSVNGRLLGQILGNSKLTKPIDGFRGLEQISKTSNYVFYSNMHKEKNLLTKTITDLFGKYKLNNELLDVVISVNNDEIVVGLNYDDSVMQLPVDKKFNKKSIDDTKAALFNSISIIEAIAEKLEK